MYGDDAADEESRVAATAVVAIGTTVWFLVDGDETEVEDDDDDKEAEAAVEAHHNVELHAVAEHVKATAEEEVVAKRVKVAEEEAAEEEAAVEAAEQAAHWATEMDKALAYQRDVDRMR
jgi:hypothetical protein